MHREQACVTDVARLLPHAAGGLVLTEAQVFRKVLDDPDRPYAVVLGGSKVSDKLGVIANLLGSVDRLLIGGGMCFTFLKAQGHEVGNSLLEADQVDTVKGLIDDAALRGVDLVLPVDVVVATRVRGGRRVQGRRRRRASSPAGWAWTSARRSIELFRSKLADARTVVWNGPMGVFEMAPFAEGTRAVAEAIIDVRRHDGRRRRRLAPPRSGCSACPRTASPTSPPVAARAWSSSRARPCPVSPCSRRTDGHRWTARRR